MGNSVERKFEMGEERKVTNLQKEMYRLKEKIKLLVEKRGNDRFAIDDTEERLATIEQVLANLVQIVDNKLKNTGEMPGLMQWADRIDALPMLKLDDDE